METSLSDNLKNCSKEAWFLAVLYPFRTKKKKSQEYIISRLQTKIQITVCIVSQNVINTCEGSLINQRSTNIDISGKEALNICF